jgi:MFS family permease
VKKERQRLFLNAFFFLAGVCFSTWASRIPTIKMHFHYNEAELGTILLFMPVSSLVGLPISGWLVTRYDSRIPMTAGFVMIAVSLVAIGISNNTVLLIASICVFAFSTRIMSISINTQAINLQKQFVNKINGTFHGMWSTGGIVGVGLSTLFVALDISIAVHFLIVASCTVLAALSAFNFLPGNDRAASGNKLSLGKPDPYIVYLGLLVFFAAICEGGMFDWSGVYFKEVVEVELFTIGYLIFMIFMALSRFLCDRIMDHFGMPRMYLLSAILVFAGVILAVAFPFFWTTLAGFCLIGFGTAAIIPMTFLLAGQSKKYSPGMAISVIATYSIVGMLIGPPMIGYIAHAFGLRVAFLAFALSGLALIPVASLFFRHRQRQA